MNSTLYLDKKIVVIESDDWGLLGVRDQEAFEKLKAKGYTAGDQDCDYYSLELPEDLEALYGVLSKHRDCFGLPPIMDFNFIMAKPDFEKIAETGFREFHTLDLSQGAPGLWKNRDKLMEAYRRGIELGLVYPGYHGLCHFRYEPWLKALQNGERDLLDCFKEHVTYVPSMRRDAFNYEYVATTQPVSFLPSGTQEEIIKKGVGAFERIFGFQPVVTTAPRYAWNSDTEQVWHKYGIQYIGGAHRQIGASSISSHRLGERNQLGMIYLSRNVSFEARRADACDDAFTEIEFLFKVRQPAILETHCLNFLSSIKNFRDKSLGRLDELLDRIEKKYPDVVYLTSRQLGELLENGHCRLRNGKRLEVERHRTTLPYWGKFYFHQKKTALKRYLS